MSQLLRKIKESRTKKSEEKRKNGEEKGKVEKEDTDGPSGRSYAYGWNKCKNYKFSSALVEVLLFH